MHVAPIGSRDKNRFTPVQKTIRVCKYHYATQKNCSTQKHQSTKHCRLLPLTFGFSPEKCKTSHLCVSFGPVTSQLDWHQMRFLPPGVTGSRSAAQDECHLNEKKRFQFNLTPGLCDHLSVNSPWHKPAPAGRHDRLDWGLIWSLQRPLLAWSGDSMCLGPVSPQLTNILQLDHF